jgi:TonB family protein
MGFLIPRDANAQWQSARLIYPFYRKLIEHLDLEMFPCRDLDSESSEAPESLARVQLWFGEADNRIDVSSIREFLQSEFVLEEATLRAVILRHLHKDPKTDSDRYKVDFLLGHYLAQNIAPTTAYSDLNLSKVGELLAPILGQIDYLSRVEELEHCLRKQEHCRSLQDLMEEGILERGREIKAAAGPNYYDPAAMIAFTRFNFLTRRCFIRLLQTELDSLAGILTTLQERGIRVMDCSAAGLSATEGIDNLRYKINRWRKPFSGKYTNTHWLEQISQLRLILSKVLERVPKHPVKVVAADGIAETDPKLAAGPDTALPSSEMTSVVSAAESQDTSLQAPEKDKSRQFSFFRTVTPASLKGPTAASQKKATRVAIAAVIASAAIVGLWRVRHSGFINMAVSKIARTFHVRSTLNAALHFPSSKVALPRLSGSQNVNTNSKPTGATVSTALPTLIGQSNSGTETPGRSRSNRREVQPKRHLASRRAIEPENRNLAPPNPTDSPKVIIEDRSGRKPKKQMLPVYPSAARQKHMTGTVKLQIRIAANGKVRMLKALAGNTVLIDSVMQAAKKWEYGPATMETAQQVLVKFIYSTD